MPIFEDKRKLTDLLKGSSLFQTHIKNVAAVLNAHVADVNVSRMMTEGRAYQPPTLVEVAPTLQGSTDRFDGRAWLNPRITDYNCAKRTVSANTLPLKLRRMSAHYVSSEVQRLLDRPLEAVNLHAHVEMMTRAARGEDAVTDKSPFRVMQHPSSNSHIARTAVARLEQDIEDFAVHENAGALPVLKATFDGNAVMPAGLDSAIASVNALVAALEQLRAKDTVAVKDGVEELLALCNSSSSDDMREVAFSLRQRAGLEVPIEFSFLAACTATSSDSRGISVYNPSAISEADSDGIISATLLLMMSANRITHATLALQQARSLQKVLEQMRPLAGVADRLTDFNRLHKELLTQSDSLAATLMMQRTYVARTGPGVYEFDPRFLLFEFCHGLLLRPSQVQLVNKLLAEMEAGRSVCHQMIMGAGKTTVVGPLLAMLLANANTLVFEVVPPALLDFSAGVLRERFSAAIRKPVFTFTFDRYTKVTPQLVAKFRTARRLRAVIVAAPSSVKSFMLKFIEICHNLNRQKNLVREEKEKKAAEKRFSLRRSVAAASTTSLSF